MEQIVDISSSGVGLGQGYLPLLLLQKRILLGFFALFPMEQSVVSSSGTVTRVVPALGRFQNLPY